MPTTNANLTITSLDEAKEIINKFNLSHGVISNTTEFPLSRQPITITELKGVKCVSASAMLELAKVLLPSVQESEFKEFLNGNEITISTSLDKINQLQNCLTDLNAEIFQDLHLNFYAMTLYLLKRITQHQVVSLLNIWQIQFENDFPIHKHHQILDENGNYTDTAQQILFQYLTTDQSHYKPLSPEQLEAFRLLILALPNSEQTFFLTGLGIYKDYKQEIVGSALVRHGFVPTVPFGGTSFLLHLPSGAHEALDLVRYGNNCRKAKLVIGAVTKEAIELGQDQHERVGTIGYQNVTAIQVHGYQKLTNWQRFAHDRLYHAEIWNSAPLCFDNILVLLKQITREKFSLQWSKEIWSWIDGDFPWFWMGQQTISAHKLTPQLMTEYFCEALFEVPGEEPAKGRHGYLLYNSSQYGIPYPTPVGIIILINMIEEPERWSEHFISPEYLSHYYKMYFTLIKEIYPLIQNESIEFQIVKCEAYFRNCFTGQKNGHLQTFENIDTYRKELLSDLKFAKRSANQTPTDRQRNTIVLMLRDTEFSYFTLHTYFSRKFIEGGYSQGFFAVPKPIPYKGRFVQAEEEQEQQARPPSPPF